MLSWRGRPATQDFCLRIEEPQSTQRTQSEEWKEISLFFSATSAFSAVTCIRASKLAGGIFPDPKSAWPAEIANVCIADPARPTSVVRNHRESMRPLQAPHALARAAPATARAAAPCRAYPMPAGSSGVDAFIPKELHSPAQGRGSAPWDVHRTRRGYPEGVA